MKSIFRRRDRFSETYILRLWDDRKHPVSTLPLIDVEYASARLTSFRSQDEWLTMFEIIGFDTEAGSCLNDIHAHGNKIPRSKYWFSHQVIDPLEDSPSYPWFETDILGNSTINPLDFTVEVKGEVRSYSLKTEDYQRYGIELGNPDVDALTKILRYLCSSAPDDVFLTNQEQLQLVGRPADLPVFIQLDDWYHPDYRSGERMEDSPCLRSLAEALSAGKPDLYECAQKLHNTHWSNWDEALKR